MENINEIDDTANLDDNAVEINTEQPEVQMADTSQEEFFYDEESAVNNQQRNQQNVEDQDNQDNFEDSDSAYSGNNQYIEALHQWADQNDVNLKELYGEFDEENFTKEHLNYVVGKTQAINHLNQTDPDLHNIVSRGINLNEYMQERMQYEKMINTDDATLFKGQMYNYLLNKNIEMGVATANEDGSLSEQSHKAIMDEIGRHTSNMTTEQFREKGESIRQNLQQQINQIPDYLQERHQAQHHQNLEKYETDRQEYMNGLKGVIDKSNNIVVGFADQSAKDDFTQFIDEQTRLSEIDVNGQKQTVVPLFHQLQNDSEFLLQTLRLQQMLKNGYFTDTTNKARNNAFKELGIMPTGKGKSGRRSNAQTHKGVNIANTSTKDFYNS